MDKTESAQVDLIRIFCILSMMWVHVSPGLSAPSLVSGGLLDGVGQFLGNGLGRISVTTLSFVSGYLFWITAANRSLRDVVRRLALTIYLPTLVWSGAYLLLTLAKTRLFGLESATPDVTAGSLMNGLNAWAGLTGPTANLSLFFIRDLIVSTLILYMCFPLLRRASWLVVLLVLPLALFDSLAPILFRPQILIFVTLGAASARAGLTIPQLSAPRIAFPCGFVLMASAYLLATRFPDVHHHDVTHDLLGRAGLGFFILATTKAMLLTMKGRAYTHISRHCFLAYLFHAPVIGALWVVWQRVIGGAQDPSYIVFYLTMPPMVMLLAVLCGRTLDLAPVGLQILLRGKTVAAVKPDAMAFVPR